MGYSAKMYENALSQLSQRRNQALLEQERRLQKIEEAIPQVAALRRELATTGIRLAGLFGQKTPEAADKLNMLREQNLDTQRRICALLDQHGYPIDYLDVQYQCHRCNDTGFVGNKRCECLLVLLKRMAEHALCDSAPASSCTFDNFDLTYYSDAKNEQLGIVPRDKMREIHAFCRTYARNFTIGAPSLFLYGQTGLGKTHLSLAIADTVVAKGFGVIYGSAQDLLRRVEREHFGRDRTELSALDTLLDTDLLILDDLGAEFETTFYTAAVYNIINTRLNRRLPTIVSSNLSAAELEKRYSDRVVSRLRSMFYNLRFVGSDIRQQKMMRKVRG